jgi:hypothetical protein
LVIVILVAGPIWGFVSAQISIGSGLLNPPNVPTWVNSWVPYVIDVIVVVATCWITITQTWSCWALTSGRKECGVPVTCSVLCLSTLTSARATGGRHSATATAANVTNVRRDTAMDDSGERLIQHQ